MSAMRDLFDDDMEMLTPGMTMMEYAEEAMNMGFYEDMLIYPALGLAGEAGEVANKVAKLMRDQNLLDIDPMWTSIWMRRSILPTSWATFCGC